MTIDGFRGNFHRRYRVRPLSVQIDMLTRFYRRTVRFMRSWKISVGADPEKVAGPALILFPFAPATLCCGLAGILTVRGTVEPDAPGADLSHLFGRVSGNDLPALLGGTINAPEYLGGNPSAEEMERELLRLKGEETFRRLFFDAGEVRRLAELSARMHEFLLTEEAILEEKAGHFSTADIEAVNRGLVLIRDLVWGLDHDILDNVQRIVSLAGACGVAEVDPEALPKYRKINTLLNCLDRLEVRGRDSAGIQISFVPADAGAALEILRSLREKGLEGELRRRTEAGDLINGSITCSPGAASGGEGAGGAALTFTYKTASIIGELGRNVRELRRHIAGDSLLHALVRLPVSFETALAHTRWASVGSITEENCHPLSNFTLPSAPSAVQEKIYPAYGTGPWSIHVVLNGDIDNYLPLREALEAGGELIAPTVTTDTKIIPLQIEKYLLAGHDLRESFRRAVGDFEGSHAIAMVSNVEPGKAYLALRGSGQSIYVGIAPDKYLFSSELYGLVEETPYFLKMDGEKPSCPDRAEMTGQLLVLDQDSPGGAAGIRGLCYDGTPLELRGKDVRKAE
ncbi:MAG: class II glutamine amidotransferase domain-containing protein, partial [Syntrophales bacterium]